MISKPKISKSYQSFPLWFGFLRFSMYLHVSLAYSEKCGENRCVLGFEVLAILCNFSREYQTWTCCIAFLKKSRESFYWFWLLEITYCLSFHRFFLRVTLRVSKSSSNVLLKNIIVTISIILICNKLMNVINYKNIINKNIKIYLIF